MATIITGTGSYIPNIIKSNHDFISNTFYGENGELIATPNQEIVDKFKDITGIYERRYASEEMNTSEMATAAARLAILDAGIDP
jgi:3-oxoacyl-[acyl-carrier-protein] synthase-3